tara:strand:+ start:7988 stop:8299 length:312 start_codon:yes stop_codon:yes gene_type:complete
MKNLDQLLEQAVKNIKEDRAVTNALLLDLMKYMKVQGDHTHEQVGPVAAKYVETLQRSNEQLVKVGTLVHKKEQAGVGLSDAEKEEIYDLINNSTEEGTEDGD